MQINKKKDGYLLKLKLILVEKIVLFSYEMSKFEWDEYFY